MDETQDALFGICRELGAHSTGEAGIGEER